MKKLRRIDGACCPLALKYLSGLPDDVVLSVCESNGYEQKCGMEEFEWLESARELHIRLTRINLKEHKLHRARLREVLSRFPKGRFLVYTNMHVFALDNGRVVDPINEVEDYIGLDRIVIGLWRARKICS